METLTSNQGWSRSDSHPVTSVRGAPEKRWVRPREEGRPPGRLGLGFCSVGRGYSSERKMSHAESGRSQLRKSTWVHRGDGGSF